MAGILLQNEKDNLLVFCRQLVCLVVQVNCTFGPFLQLFIHAHIWVTTVIHIVFQGHDCTQGVLSKIWSKLSNRFLEYWKCPFAAGSAMWDTQQGLHQFADCRESHLQTLENPNSSDAPGWIYPSNTHGNWHFHSSLKFDFFASSLKY